ncbi:MAG: hypothetical protein RLZZ182_743 [Pseudomonadota bacterium]|jgi:hypothetical protein
MNADNGPMTLLRPFVRDLARCVLAWWIAVVGLGAWAPALAAANELGAVCSVRSSGAERLTAQEQAGKGVAGHHGLDCLMCCHAPTLPSPPVILLPHALPLGHVLQSIPAARLAALVSAPLPARGPPA